MPEFVDLKLPVKTKAECMPCSDVSDQPQYPYNTRIDMDKEMLAKFPMLHSVEAGEEVTIVAKASVTEIRVSPTTPDDPKPKRKSVELQMTDMAITRDEQTELNSAFETATAKA